MRPPMTHRFIAACRKQPVDRLPVWMMRQAGRYQPSYRAVRQNVGFLELCRSPELIAQVTVAPIDEFGFDAAILFSDILVHLPAMGLDLSFEKGEKGVKCIRTALAGRVPLIGFVGGPFTVASYVVEGGSQGFTRLKTMLYAEPKTAHALFEKLTRAAIVQIEAQIAAGAEAAQIFESWLGELDRYDLEEFSFPYLARIVEAVKKTGVPVIFFGTGMGGHLERLAQLGFDVLSVDWRIPIDEARARVPHVAVQGNMDSSVLLGPKEVAVERARRIMQAAGPKTGYIFNLGHGLTPATPTENVKAVVDAVHAFTWK